MGTRPQRALEPSLYLLYYTKYKAVQSKIVQPENAINFIKYNKIFSYSFNILANILCYWCRVDVIFIVCANEHIVVKWYTKLLLGSLIYSVPLVQIVATIVCEVKLKRLFVSQKETNSHQSNAWRTVGANLEANNIPQKSAYIAACKILFIILLICVYKSGALLDDTLASALNLQSANTLIVSILMVLHLPIILAFTYNHRFNKVGIPKIQSLELQSHINTTNFNTNEPHCFDHRE